MEIVVSREAVLKTMSRVQGIIEKKSNMAILSTVLMTASSGRIHISATDLELGFQESLPAMVVEEGAITLPGRKFFEIVKETRRDELSLKELPNKKVLISDGAARFDLSYIPPDEYPPIMEVSDITHLPFKGALLSEMVSKTIYAVSTEDSGYKLSGVFLQTGIEDTTGLPILTMVATDGHRLSLVEAQGSDLEFLGIKDGIMVPRKGIAELGKLASEYETLEIGVQKKLFQARTENLRLVIRLLDSKFPDYRSVIPKSSDITKIYLKRTDLLEAMKRMLILCDDRYKAVRITLDSDVMVFFSTNPDLGEAVENIAVRYRGERMEVAFNPKFFIEALQPLVSEEISMGFVDAQKPCVITGEADLGFMGLIMPMRL